MCAAVCSRNAITIKLNEEGFYRPYVDEKKCIDCGLCTRVCYKFEDDVKVTSNKELGYLDVYSAQLKSDEILKKVTSGGVADVLAKELIKQGYTCVGVTYNSDNHRAEHVVVRSGEKTDAFRGSKYIQSYSYDAFKELVSSVRDTKYAVFGLPCHIYAIHKYLVLCKQREKCILVDLFCHGCPSMLVWNKYERKIKTYVGSEKVENVQFRSKVNGWGTFHVSLESEGGKVFVSNPQSDEFYSLFFSDYVLNDSCADCKLRSTMEYTDIRLGDFWGKRFLCDKKGVSAIAITSEKGKQLFDAIKGQFRIGKSNMQEVLVKQSYGKTYSPEPNLRKRMLESLQDETQSLSQTLAIFESKQGIGYKVKKAIKLIDWYLPFDLTRLLKYLAW